MNKNILKICKHYNEIVECEFLDDDVFSKKLVSFYKSIVENIDLENENSIKKAMRLDEAIYNYIEDYSFSKKFKDSIDVSTVVSDNFSYLNEFIEYLISFFVQYENSKETVVVQTKWI
jgi:hypothetical protein